MAKNLKTVFLADISDLEKGTKQATKAVKNFDKQASGAISSLGKAIGANTGSIGQMSQAFSGASAKIAQASGASTEKVAGLIRAFGAFGAAAGAIGVTVAAVWKNLSSEADYYGTRLDGLANNAGMHAYVDTMKALRHDHRDGAGIQEFVSKIKKAWSSIGNAVQSVYYQIFRPGQQAPSFRDDQETAGRAEKLAKRLTELQLQELDTRVQVSEIDAQIAVSRQKIRDTDIDLISRKAEEARLAELIEEKYKIQQPILSEQLELTKELYSLTNSSLADKETEVNLEMRLNSLTREKAELIKSTMRDSQRLDREIASMIKKTEQLALDESMQELEIEIEVNDQALQEDIADSVNKAMAAVDNMPPLTLHVDTLPIQKSIDLLPSLENAFKNTAATIGEALGTMFTGNTQEAAESLEAGLLNTLGGLAISVGELAVSTGTAILGIKVALDNINPYVAIAAGAALIALGSAVRSAASNLASGASVSSYASSTTYSPTASGYSNDLMTRELNVNVKGTLVANGSQLVAVLNNEQNRKNHTT